MYQVLDNELPADCHHHNVDDSWNKSTFDSLKDAVEYARKWLGDHDIIPGAFALPLKKDYSGLGDTIEIVAIPEKDSVTVDEVKRLKAELEKEIQQSLEAFRKESGCVISNIITTSTDPHGVTGMDLEVML